MFWTLFVGMKYIAEILSPQIFTCSKLTIQTPEKGVKYVQS